MQRRPGRRDRERPEPAAEARQAALVLLHPDAGPGRPPDAVDRHRLDELRGRTSSATSRSTRRSCGSSRSASTPTTFRPPKRAAGPRPDRRGLQLRQPDQGREGAARGGRQAAHRSRRRARRRRQAEPRWPGRPRGQGPQPRRHRPVRLRACPTTGSPSCSAPPRSPSCPSLYEGFSIPAVEAMACATPLIATTRRRAARGRRHRRQDRRARHARRPGRARRRARRAARRRRAPASRSVLPVASGSRRRTPGVAVAESMVEVYREAIDARPVQAHDSGRAGGSQMLTVDFDAVPDRPGRPGARPRLRRRPARLRALPPRRAVVAFDHSRRGAAPGRDDVPRDEHERRGARRRRDRDGRPGRRAVAAVPGRRRSTRSSPPRCSSTSPTTSARWPRSPASSSPAAGSPSTVPRWWPEQINWALSREYHDVPGGHIRIYRGDQVTARLAERRPAIRARSHHAHALHSPYWWLNCTFGRESLPSRTCNKLLVWDIIVGAVAHPHRREAAQPGDGQEPGRVRRQARGRPGSASAAATELTSRAVDGVITAEQVRATARVDRRERRRPTARSRGSPAVTATRGTTSSARWR